MEICLLQTPLTVVRGPLLDELHQQLNSWISQVIHPLETRLMHQLLSLELLFTLICSSHISDSRIRKLLFTSL